MKNKKTKFILLSLAVVVFLAGGCVNSGKTQQLKDEVTRLNKIIQQKDAKVRTLIDQAQSNQKNVDVITKELDSTKKELDGAKKELDTTKKELDSVNKKLGALTPKPITLKK
jgi:peptidoglycan hydrolase CwlO-like protein